MLFRRGIYCGEARCIEGFGNEVLSWGGYFLGGGMGIGLRGKLGGMFEPHFMFLV